MASLDPRLAALYDVDNPGGRDHDWFRALADRLDARTIVDLGCGTGLLTASLAGPDRRIIGVDPDVEMLNVADRRDNCRRANWVLGDSRAIGGVDADLVVMSGNVAQHIRDDAWGRTLADIHAALRPGGVLAFESRNPLARAWLQWNRDKTYGTRDTPSGPLTEWMEVVAVMDEGDVTFEAHNIFEATGEHLVYVETLAFRDAERITADLKAAGLIVEQLWGGWSRQRPSPDSSLLVFEATRPELPALRRA